ncbi:hypothetical protein PR048_031251 [Dryococelus australis]|uniref:Uncharacterized protein n=1 Tax=Dryococelus australis TaxID=614101 RepID=A0ABQ9G8T7_9NEOP|nr:hypothetical protein PR048_031251 [Dryococelus australis]
MSVQVPHPPLLALCLFNSSSFPRGWKSLWPGEHQQPPLASPTLQPPILFSNHTSRELRLHPTLLHPLGLHHTPGMAFSTFAGLGLQVSPPTTPILNPSANPGPA